MHTSSLLVVARDQHLPLPAAAILISPWVDLTHSFESIGRPCPDDYLPPYGLLHRPSLVWPPPNADELEAITRGAMDVATGRHNIRGIGGGGTDLQSVIDGFSVRQKQGVEADLRDVGGGSNGDNGNGNGNGNDDLNVSGHSRRRPAPQPPPPYCPLTLELGGQVVEIKDQVQLYAPNHLLTHPLVSPLLQPSLGGLPPLLIITGGGERLRDEQLYVAHKAADPLGYPSGPHVMKDHDPNGQMVARFPPTDVVLQVYDGLCHVPPTVSFAAPVQPAYHAIVEFSAWALARASGAGRQGDDGGVDVPPTINSSEKKKNNNKGKNALPAGATGRIGCGSPSPFAFDNHMVRQRIDRHGYTYPLEPAAAIPALCTPPAQVGAITPTPVLNWLAAKHVWDGHHARAKLEVQDMRVREMLLATAKKGGIGTWAQLGEWPPPCSLAAKWGVCTGSEVGGGGGNKDVQKRRTGKGKGKGWGMRSWASMGKGRNEKRVMRKSAGLLGDGTSGSLDDRAVVDSGAILPALGISTSGGRRESRENREKFRPQSGQDLVYGYGHDLSPASAATAAAPTSAAAPAPTAAAAAPPTSRPRPYSTDSIPVSVTDGEGPTAAASDSRSHLALPGAQPSGGLWRTSTARSGGGSRVSSAMMGGGGGGAAAASRPSLVPVPTGSSNYDNPSSPSERSSAVGLPELLGAARRGDEDVRVEGEGEKRDRGAGKGEGEGEGGEEAEEEGLRTAHAHARPRSPSPTAIPGFARRAWNTKGGRGDDSSRTTAAAAGIIPTGRTTSSLPSSLSPAAEAAAAGTPFSSRRKSRPAALNFAADGATPAAIVMGKRSSDKHQPASDSSRRRLLSPRRRTGRGRHGHGHGHGRGYGYGHGYGDEEDEYDQNAEDEYTSQQEESDADADADADINADINAGVYASQHRRHPPKAAENSAPLRRLITPPSAAAGAAGARGVGAGVGVGAGKTPVGGERRQPWQRRQRRIPHKIAKYPHVNDNGDNDSDDDNDEEPDGDDEEQPDDEDDQEAAGMVGASDAEAQNASTVDLVGAPGIVTPIPPVTPVTPVAPVAPLSPVSPRHVSRQHQNQNQYQNRYEHLYQRRHPQSVFDADPAASAWSGRTWTQFGSVVPDNNNRKPQSAEPKLPPPTTTTTRGARDGRPLTPPPTPPSPPPSKLARRVPPPLRVSKAKTKDKAKVSPQRQQQSPQQPPQQPPPLLSPKPVIGSPLAAGRVENKDGAESGFGFGGVDEGVDVDMEVPAVPPKSPSRMAAARARKWSWRTPERDAYAGGSAGGGDDGAMSGLGIMGYGGHDHDYEREREQQYRGWSSGGESGGAGRPLKLASFRQRSAAAGGVDGVGGLDDPATRSTQTQMAPSKSHPRSQRIGGQAGLGSDYSGGLGLGLYGGGAGGGVQGTPPQGMGAETESELEPTASLSRSDAEEFA